MTSSILTRKFRLHWVQNPRENQIHLHQFFQDYIKKANRLIAYIFSLQTQLNATDPTQFHQLFRKTGKIAYNDLYTYGLDLKHYNREITAGLRFKQRTMRMLCNDVYYAIRNFLIRHHNLKQILMVLLQSPKSINWDLFVRKGRLSQRTYRQLKQHLRKDCYDEQQIFSQVFLTNYLRQLRNLVFDQITPSIKAMWLAHPTDHHLEISQTVQNTYKNLDNLLPYPQLSNLTCSLPSKDSLWDISETKHSIVFTFQPIVHQRFQFRLLKSKLRHHHSELHTYSFSSIFKLVPTLQYASKGVTLCQPISVSATPISSASSRIMGIDLGLKTLATCSIGTDATEVGRTFITPKNLFSTRIDPQSGRTIPRTTQIQSQGNIWRRLYNLRRSVWKTQQQKDRVSNPERVQKFHNLLTRIWRNILHLHQEIRNQIVHKLVTLARAFQVRIIKFEDLRWSRARSKRKQGMWLTHHQLHWFHGEIIRHTIQMAARFGIRVVRVNAYLSSQLDADQVLLTGVGRVIPSKTSRAQFQDILGFRRGKQFWGIIDSSGRRKRIDADLNAARNIRLRTPIL